MVTLKASGQEAERLELYREVGSAGGPAGRAARNEAQCLELRTEARERAVEPWGHGLWRGSE